MKVQVTTKLACDFCGKTHDQVAALIAGPRQVCICNECVALCQEIISERSAPAPEPTPAEQGA